MESPFEIKETIYYGAVWLVSFLAGLSQSLQRTNYVGCRHAISVSMVAGFFGFAAIAIIDGNAVDHAGDEFTYLGLATMIGLSASDHEKLFKKIRDAILERFFFVPPSKEEDETTDK